MKMNWIFYELCDQLDQFEVEEKEGSVPESDDRSTFKTEQGKRGYCRAQ